MAGHFQHGDKGHGIWALPALLLAGAALLARPAAAEVSASGTRISVAGGPARGYMTYGHAEEPELYAPLAEELARFSVRFQRSGKYLVVFHRNQKVARWPLVFSRDDVPESGDCALFLGGRFFVPLRALGERVPVQLKWNKGDNLVALVPGKATPRIVRPSAPAAPPKAFSPKGNPATTVLLTGIELERDGASLLLKVRAEGAVEPVVTPIRSSLPHRVAVDFPGARWAQQVSLPSVHGDVTEIRTGHPKPGVARLTLVLNSPAVRVTGIDAQDDAVRLRVGRGVITAPSAQKVAVLTGVTLRPAPGGLRVEVTTTLPVKPRWVLVRSTRPYRLALDFPGARWDPGVTEPAVLGDVNGVRIGTPTPGIARLTLALRSTNVRVTSAVVDSELVTFALGQGQEAKQARMKAPARQILTAIRKPALPSPRPIGRGALIGRTVVVDAGHGGHSAGARGLRHLEKNLCLQMSREFAATLRELGAEVVMTRSGDEFVSLDDRCRIANRYPKAIFVSIHCNSTPERNSASGSESYWHNSLESYRLARTLHPYLVRSVGRRDGGVRNRSFQVVRETRIPSVLLEIAFINNSSDEKLLADPAFQKRLGDQLARGVVEYYAPRRASADEVLPETPGD